MAISKYINKLNHVEGVVKVVNDSASAATTTITLNADMLKSNETLSGAVPRVNISAVEAAVSNGSKITVTRGGKVVALYFENTNQVLNIYGADSENNSSDIVLNFTGEGMVIIRLLKLAGYSPNFRPEQGIG